MFGAVFEPSSQKNKIFVGGFPVHLSQIDLKDYMSQFGQVLAVKILKKNGHSRGFGFVTFKAAVVAQYVITLRHEIEGQEVGFEIGFSAIIENLF